MYHYRISDQTPLKTKRLILTPMNGKQLEAMQQRITDDLMRGALNEMRRGVLENSEQALWYTGWEVTLRQSGESVGLIGFQGVQTDKTVEMAYDIFLAYRTNGYAGEAIQSLCDWAFGRENVYFIQVLANEQNGAANHILNKLKFYRVESPVEGQIRWELERPASAWLAIYMSIGLSLGLALGSSFFGNMLTGMAIGISTGLALGVALDSQDRAARKREHAPKKLDEEKTSDQKK